MKYIFFFFSIFKLNKIAIHAPWYVWWLSWNVIFFDCWLFKSKLDTQSISMLVCICMRANDTHTSCSENAIDTMSMCFTKTFTAIEWWNFQLVVPRGPFTSLLKHRFYQFFFLSIYVYWTAFSSYVNYQESNKTSKMPQKVSK